MEKKMMQKSVGYNAVAAIIPASLLSVVFLISAVHYNVAQAKSRTATAVALRQRTTKTMQRCACEGKQHARMPSKGSGFRKMCRIGAPCCAHV
jgi:hypothetical protein